MGEYDLTTEPDVVALMEQSKTESEWNDNCARVKDANGCDYPSFWWKAIMLSGVVGRTKAKWDMWRDRP